jgi:hypothetical protein
MLPSKSMTCRLPGLGRLAAEHPKGQRADIDAARRIGGQVARCEASVLSVLKSILSVPSLKPTIVS